MAILRARFMMCIPCACSRRRAEPPACSGLISESSGPEVAAVIGTVVTINSTLSFRPVFCHLLRQEAHINRHDMMVSKETPMNRHGMMVSDGRTTVQRHVSHMSVSSNAPGRCLGVHLVAEIC